jgi:hypothetical protein
MNQSEIKKYALRCSGVKTIIVDGRRNKKKFDLFENSFSFAVFNNVLHLSLHGISEITQVNLYLEKTVKLEVVQSVNLREITAWNSEKVLREVILRDCLGLEILPPLENISAISIVGSERTSFQVGRQKKLSYQGNSLSVDTLKAISTEMPFLSSLEELKLDSCFCPTEFIDFSWCLNIAVLELSFGFFLRHSTSVPSFPSGYYGKRLLFVCLVVTALLS